MHIGRQETGGIVRRVSSLQLVRCTNVAVTFGVTSLFEGMSQTLRRSNERFPRVLPLQTFDVVNVSRRF